jgi:hypothetical protein
MAGGRWTKENSPGARARSSRLRKGMWFLTVTPSGAWGLPPRFGAIALL